MFLRKKSKKGMDDRYGELIRELKETDNNDFTRYQRIHKELKKYGDGVWWLARHPDAYMYAALICLISALVINILGIITRTTM